jgi:hypothetical protein
MNWQYYVTIVLSHSTLHISVGMHGGKKPAVSLSVYGLYIQTWASSASTESSPTYESAATIRDSPSSEIIWCNWWEELSFWLEPYERNTRKLNREHRKQSGQCSKCMYVCVQTDKRGVTDIFWQGGIFRTGYQTFVIQRMLLLSTDLDPSEWKSSNFLLPSCSAFRVHILLYSIPVSFCDVKLVQQMTPNSINLQNDENLSEMCNAIPGPSSK